MIPDLIYKDAAGVILVIKLCIRICESSPILWFTVGLLRDFVSFVSGNLQPSLHCRPATAVNECACSFLVGRGVGILKDVRGSRGLKGKQNNADKGREGVQNPENFADVLYEWSLMLRY